jgi:DtxR family transcriptional regulator, Mn-dependent transcriptional regulator
VKAAAVEIVLQVDVIAHINRRKIPRKIKYNKIQSLYYMDGINMSDEILISPSLENYVEVIFELCHKNAVVRVTDLAEKLSIAKSSVNQAVTALVQLGLVKHEKYGPLELTSKGNELAGSISKRHRVLKTFFTEILEVDTEIAEKDACSIEHLISPVTMEKLISYLENHEELVRLKEIDRA